MCGKKEDITAIEFFDYCKDGLLDVVKKTINENHDPRRLLEAYDDDRKTCLHLVSCSF